MVQSVQVRKKASEGRHSGLIDIAAADLLEKVCSCRAVLCCDFKLAGGKISFKLGGEVDSRSGEDLVSWWVFRYSCTECGVHAMCLVYFSKELGPFQAFLRFFDFTSPSNGFRSQRFH